MELSERVLIWNKNFLRADWRKPVSPLPKITPAASKHVLPYGTSFSAPYVASICAMTLSFHPEYSVDDLKDAVKETATPYDDFNGDISKIYGTGVADAIGAVGLPRPSLSVNLKPGKYTEKISVDFSSNYDIYYTMDGTYPTEETGILFQSRLISTEIWN